MHKFGPRKFYALSDLCNRIFVTVCDIFVTLPNVWQIGKLKPPWIVNKDHASIFYFASAASELGIYEVDEEAPWRLSLSQPLECKPSQAFHRGKLSLFNHWQWPQSRWWWELGRSGGRWVDPPSLHGFYGFHQTSLRLAKLRKCLTGCLMWQFYFFMW